MAKQIFTNFARTTLAAGIGTGDTSISVTDGSLFGSPTGGDWQVAVIDNGTAFEVIHITARTGNTLTVVRAQESTSAASWSSGDSILAPVTAAFCTPLAQIDLTTTVVTGALPETKGGTGQSTYTLGDILYSSAANTLSKLGIGSTNAVLQVISGIPGWTTTPTIPTLTIGTALQGTATNPADAGIIRLGNNQIVNWRDSGNTANIGMGLDGSDIFLMPVAVLQFGNNKYLVGRNNAGSANVNILKVNTNDKVQFGNSATDQKFGFGGDPTHLLHVLGDLGGKVTHYTSGPTTIADTVIATADATSGAFTLNLPAVGTNADKIVAVIKVDASANAVTVSGNGSNINGGASVSLASQYNVTLLFCNGTQWYKIV